MKTQLVLVFALLICFTFADKNDLTKDQLNQLKALHYKVITSTNFAFSPVDTKLTTSSGSIIRAYRIKVVKGVVDEPVDIKQGTQRVVGPRGSYEYQAVTIYNKRILLDLEMNYSIDNGDVLTTKGQVEILNPFEERWLGYNYFTYGFRVQQFPAYYDDNNYAASKEITWTFPELKLVISQRAHIIADGLTAALQLGFQEAMIKALKDLNKKNLEFLA